MPRKIPRLPPIPEKSLLELTQRNIDQINARGGDTKAMQAALDQLKKRQQKDAG